MRSSGCGISLIAQGGATIRVKCYDPGSPGSVSLIKLLMCSRVLVTEGLGLPSMVVLG